MTRDRSGRSTLKAEDRQLWSRVVESVRPLLSGHALPTPGPDRAKHVPGSTQSSPPPIPAPPSERPYNATIPKPAKRMNAKSGVSAKPAVRAPDRLYSKTTRRIAKGRTAIDSRIDLHGMTRDDARGHLLNFLSMAGAMQHRTVLVITGKGFSGEGVLRREVPQWLSTAPFAVLVSAVEQASAKHGGEGALYVRLRRRS